MVGILNGESGSHCFFDNEPENRCRCKYNYIATSSVTGFDVLANYTIEVLS